MKAVTRDQLGTFLARVAHQVSYQQLDGNRFQQILELPLDQFDALFTAFLHNGCQLSVIGSPKLRIVPFDVAEFINPEWKIWRGQADGNGLEGDEDCDPRNDDLNEIDWSQVQFPTCLQGDEVRIVGEEKLLRMKAAPEIRLGGGAFLSLWQDYQANRENSVLEWLYRNKKITYVDFMGLVLRRPDGRRCVLYLCRLDGGTWYWNCRWLGSGWVAQSFSASLASVEIGA